MNLASKNTITYINALYPTHISITMFAIPKRYNATMCDIPEDLMDILGMRNMLKNCE